MVNSYQKNEEDRMREIKMELALPEKVCEDLRTFCGQCGLTLDVLLECLIGDITGGVHTQGSDERIYARMWFDNVYSKISIKDASFDID